MTSIWRRIRELPGWMRAVMAGQVVSSAGALAWIYLTLYLVEDRGMSASAAGLAAAAYGAGLLAGNLGGGWIGDRIGLREAVIASLLSWCFACLLMPILPTSALAVAAVVAGACGGATRPNLSALVATALPVDRRREAIALSRAASNAGFVLGPPLGGILAAYDFDAVFVVDAVSSVVLAIVVWRFVPRAARTGSGAGIVPGFWKALTREVVVLLGAVIVLDTVYRQVYATLPLLLRDGGAPAVTYGVLVGLNAAGIVLFEAPTAVWLRSRRALYVVGAGFAFVAVGLALLWGAASGVWPLVVGAVMAILAITVGEMMYKPTATAHVADAAPEGMVGRFSSLYAAASISGMVFAPALGGAVYEHAPRLLWPLATGLALAAAITVLGVGRGGLPSGSRGRRSSLSAPPR